MQSALALTYPLGERMEKATELNATQTETKPKAAPEISVKILQIMFAVGLGSIILSLAIWVCSFVWADIIRRLAP